MGDITDPNFKSKEEKLKEKKAKLKNPDGIRSKVIDARLKHVDKKKKKAMEKAEKYAMVEVTPGKKTGVIKKEEGKLSAEEIAEAKRRAEESENYEPSGIVGSTVVVDAHDNKRGKNVTGDYTVSVGPEGEEGKKASRHVAMAFKKGSVHYKTGPVQYQNKSNLRMDDMVTTVGPLQGETQPETMYTQQDSLQKMGVIEKYKLKRAMKKSQNQ